MTAPRAGDEEQLIRDVLLNTSELIASSSDVGGHRLGGAAAVDAVTSMQTP